MPIRAVKISGVTMHSLQYVYEMKAYRVDRICLPINQRAAGRILMKFGNYIMPWRLLHIYTLAAAVNATNAMDEQTCEVGTSLNLGS
jgi:hypothetical protein